MLHIKIPIFERLKIPCLSAILTKKTKQEKIDIREGIMMKNRIAYCGLDCEACDAYLATMRDDQALREETARKWSELNHVTILPEQIQCEGCRADGKKTVFCESLCAIRQCAMQKGVETCGGCPDLEQCQTVATVISNNPDALKNLKG